MTKVVLHWEASSNVTFHGESDPIEFDTREEADQYLNSGHEIVFDAIEASGFDCWGEIVDD